MDAKNDRSGFRGQTNTDFVVELMEWSSHGALTQMFIIDAISQHADAVAQADPSEVDCPLFSGAAWIACARDIKARMDAKYGCRDHRQADLRAGAQHR
jgi:hypothetical protein